MSTTVVLNTISLAVVFTVVVWWWKKGFSLPTLGNPLSGSTATKIQSVLSVQTLIVMSVFASFEFALWKTHWLPDLFEGAGLWHIPYYGALIFLTNLVSEKTTGDRKTALMRTMFVIFVISGISHLVSKESIDKFVARWNAPPATETTLVVPPVPERRVVRTAPTCPGTIETVVVGSKWVEINPGYRCAVVFDTKQGVALVGEHHNYVEDAPGIQTGNVMKSKGVKVIYARAKFDQARVEYVLCPYGTTTPGKMTCG